MDEVTIVETKQKPPPSRPSHSDSDFDPDSDLPNMPSSSARASSSRSCPSPASSPLPDSSQPPRRSSRIRNKPHHFINDPVSSSLSAGGKEHDEEASSCPHRLEQIDCISPKDFGLPDTHPTSRLHVAVHPVAMAMVTLHSHLTRTEVIGYLGGSIQQTPSSTNIVIAEAFPAQALTDRALARSGRSAYTEVEIDPESSVEVMARVSGKGLQVVGWYHSHPDASFTVEPSRVDIENQANYQRYIFKDSPFVAAIVAPYNEELPDHNPDVLFFQVHDGDEQDTPIRLPFNVDTIPSQPTQLHTGALAEYARADARFPVDAFVAESLNLVSCYALFTKRVRLEREWRGGVDCVDKLRNALATLADERERDSEQMRDDKRRFLEGVQCVMDSIEAAWAESARKDDERTARNREAARRRKRGRKR